MFGKLGIMGWVAPYAATLVAMLAVDGLWLSLTASPLYRAHIGHLMAKSFAPAPAALFYLLYVAGVTALATTPSASWTGAAARGAILGLVAYGTYDLTNQATLRDWPWLVTAADLAWGTALTAFGAVVGYGVVRWLGRTA